MNTGNAAPRLTRGRWVVASVVTVPPPARRTTLDDSSVTIGTVTKTTSAMTNSTNAEAFAASALDIRKPRKVTYSMMAFGARRVNQWAAHRPDRGQAFRGRVRTCAVSTARPQEAATSPSALTFEQAMRPASSCRCWRTKCTEVMEALRFRTAEPLVGISARRVGRAWPP